MKNMGDHFQASQRAESTYDLKPIHKYLFSVYFDDFYCT